MKHFYTQV